MRWHEEYAVDEVNIRLREGRLYAGIGGVPKHGFFVVTVESTTRWMVIGVTRTAEEAVGYMKGLEVTGVPVHPNVCGQFKGYANI